MQTSIVVGRLADGKTAAVTTALPAGGSRRVGLRLHALHHHYQFVVME